MFLEDMVKYLQNMGVWVGGRMNIALAVESVKDIILHAGKTGEIRAPLNLKNKRLKICEKCKYLKGLRCSQCGCFMHIKADLIATRCPLDIWDAKMIEEIAMGDDYDERIDPHIYKENCCG